MGQIKIYKIKKTTSTNDVAKKIAKNESTDFVVLAEEQTSGRGRKDRSWKSPPGNLYFSLCIEKGPILSLKTSVAVAMTLEKLEITPGVKWPNDILVDEKKICGILTEIIEGRGIVGIGLNVNSAPIEDSTCVSELTEAEHSPKSLMEDIVFNFYEIEDVMVQYIHYSSTIGEKVRIKTAEEEFEGIVKDIDEKGRLVLQDGRRFLSGDVIHLRKG
ncbi:MAG: biotin--[acetyl-CoA-carboxylase] ligase [Thermoplasmata archaeon]